MNTFKEFYNRQRQKFFAYLIRRAGDYHLACDIMQESFARLYEKYAAEHFTPQLLYTIGRNLVLDALRKRKSNPAAIDDAEPTADSQEHYLMVRDEYRQVLAAMRHLEGDERDLLSLVVSSELSYRELAEIMGLSEANVKVKIHRAQEAENLPWSGAAMNDQLISMYIDDELDLDDKIVFVETVHADRQFKDEAVDLLRQEKLIRADVVDRLPVLSIRERSKPGWSKLFRPFAAAELAAAAIVWLTFWQSPEPTLRPWRFVIYQPDAQGVEIAGSFSSWKRIPLKHAGNSGYWEITLDLPKGDHRFSYIIEGSRRMADPTIAVREADDFGGENSILTVNL